MKTNCVDRLGDVLPAYGVDRCFADPGTSEMLAMGIGLDPVRRDQAIFPDE